MTSYTSTSSYGAPKKSNPRWLLPALLLILIGGPVAYGAMSYVRTIIDAPRFDQNWCVEGKAASDIVVFLPDQTDAYSPRHVHALNVAYQSLVTENPSVPVRGRIVMLTMDAKSNGTARQDDRFCRPPQTTEES